MTRPGCPACGAADSRSLGRVGPVPVLCGSLWDTHEAAVATPVASLELRACRTCGHVWNATFDPSLVEYDAKYDNALDFSPTFNAFSDVLAKHLVDVFDLRGKRVVEIGSGKGEFLRQLCAVGDNTGVGYDPTYEGPAEADGIRFVRSFFTPDTAAGTIDFLCCRHVLEHLQDPYGFLLSIRATVGEAATPMYFEVPNAEFNFAESGPWDLIYPHVAYFSDNSLRALLSGAGFRVLRLEPVFNGQFLGAEVVVDSGAPMHADHERGATLTESYVRALDRQLAAVDGWRHRLDEVRAAGEVAVWGAGSKGVTFLSLVDPDHVVGAVVDANPRKSKRFLPGPGHEVVAPDELSGRSAATVLVMNAVYEEEIRRALIDSGVDAELVVV